MSKFVPSIGEVALEEFKGKTGIKAMVEAVMESCNTLTKVTVEETINVQYMLVGLEGVDLLNR